MKYLLLFGIIIACGILNFIIALTFRVKTKSNAPDYDKIILEHSNNIFVYGLTGMAGLFLGNMFGGWITYLAIGIFGFLTVIDIFRMIVMFGTTVILTFTKDHKGIADSGKLSDWIIFASSMLESGLMVFITYKMYVEFSS